MSGSSPSGYSGTPPAKKLGIAASSRVLALDAPDGYRALLAPLPEGVTFLHRAGERVDIAHVFVTRQEELRRHLAALRSALRPDAVVWVSWPKRAARVATDVTEDTIREVALPMGYVDVKVCAVDAVWSGLKLMIRKGLR